MRRQWRMLNFVGLKRLAHVFLGLDDPIPDEAIRHESILNSQCSEELWQTYSEVCRASQRFGGIECECAEVFEIGVRHSIAADLTAVFRAPFMIYVVRSI